MSALTKLMQRVIDERQQTMTKPTKDIEITDVYHPTPADLQQLAERKVMQPVVQITEVTNGNGETIRVAQAENGDVVATEKKQNLAPLAIAAALAYFFLM